MKKIYGHSLCVSAVAAATVLSAGGAFSAGSHNFASNPEMLIASSQMNNPDSSTGSDSSSSTDSRSGSPDDMSNSPSGSSTQGTNSSTLGKSASQTKIESLPNKGTVKVSGIVDQVKGNNSFVLKDSTGSVTVKGDQNSISKVSEGAAVTVVGNIDDKLFGKDIRASTISIDSEASSTGANTPRQPAGSY